MEIVLIVRQEHNSSLQAGIQIRSNIPQNSAKIAAQYHTDTDADQANGSQNAHSDDKYLQRVFHCTSTSR